MGTTTNTGRRKKTEIDVLLVLIIIFMVIIPLTPRGLPALVAQPPLSDPHDEKWSPEIVVTVRSDGTLLLNGETLNIVSLRVRLEHFYKNGAAGEIFVRGERAIEFGRAAEVVDMARGVVITR
jgi:biopolymer transport protein ExbD